MSRIVVSTVLLTGVYLLTLASREPWDVAIGAAVALALVLAASRFVFERPLAPIVRFWPRLAAFPAFAIAVLIDVARSTGEVAAISIGLRPLRAPGVIDVPMGERTPLGVVVTALVVTLSPGSVLLDLDWDGRVMRFHAIDAADPEAFRIAQANMYRRYQRFVFP
ncbi:MAG TPA: Na+/H+ antiporter subunit E [Thermomicrobiales bacterium]|nr:Na+/H+ antiporter subunit E [Thermomicrobiales bacterium]